MCFVLSCAIYFSAIALAGWLSVYRITSFFCSNVNPNSDKSCIVHIISYTAADIAMCSASADESATVGWHLLFQLITPPPFTHIVYPVVDLRVSIHPPHSLSKYPLTSIPILKSMAGISQHSWILFLPCNCNSCSTLVLVHHWLIVSR